MGSRLVLGASTLALVVVASGGTAILVTQGTSQLQREPSAAPPPLFVEPRPEQTPLVVPRSPGSALFGPTRPVAPPAPPVEPVVEVPVAVDLPPVVGPSVAPPVVEPPSVEPPVVEPPVGEPPVVEPPAVEPPVEEPAAKPRVVKPGKGKSGPARAKKSHKGHHYGQLWHPRG